MRTFDYAISLGPDCRTKHQLLRRFGEEGCPSSIFDWQVTPRSALLQYFRNDFRGMFELSDLVISKSGAVLNTRYSTTHLHEFPAGITLHEIPTHYQRARSRHDYLCDKLRALLRTKRLLLVDAERPSIKHRMQMLALMRWRFPLASVTVLTGLPDLETDWKGTDAIWDRLFDGIALTSRAESFRDFAVPADR